jgi:2,4-dienoyl-CoA reductase-like NADH-dependent reductase (Old Yellow Enzyme family)
MGLYEPLSFKSGSTAANRIALAPMTNKQSHEDGTLSDDELHWLTARADGGFGIVMSCATHVAKDGQGWPGELGIFGDEHIPGWSRVAAAMRTRGALSFAQIFHGGVRADATVSGVQPWSASEGEGARAATEEDLERVIGQFVAGAMRAKSAGLDGVEIHGAHGYLFTQFLSRTMNRREDRWGGSLENRARLLREVTRKIRSRVGHDFTVGVRLSPEDFGNAKGLDLDESLQVASWLAEDGVDFVHVSLWRSQQNTAKRPEEHALPLFRKAIPSDVRLLVAGTIWTRGEADHLLELGADGVALGRSAIVNPHWPILARDPSWEPKRPPVSLEDLRAAGLSPRFAEYMKAWKGFVREEPAAR